MEKSITGEYDVNQYDAAGDPTLYPETMTRVVVVEDCDGYYDVIGLDADGEIVARGHRARHRIEGALDGDPGYDAVVAAR